jgi:hypothetical protein
MTERDEAPSVTTDRRDLLARCAAAVARARSLRSRYDLLAEQSQRLQEASTRSRRARQEPAGQQQEGPELRSALRDAAKSYARELRARDVSPQAMLILVKNAADVHAAAPLAPFEAAEIVGDVVRWSIEAYYEAGA